MAAQNDSTLARLDMITSIERRRNACSGPLGWASVRECPRARANGRALEEAARLAASGKLPGRVLALQTGPGYPSVPLWLMLVLIVVASAVFIAIFELAGFGDVTRFNTPGP